MVFLSYSWKDSKIVDLVETKINNFNDNIEVLRDTSKIKSWESIKKFMENIKNAEYAILFISKAYLESKNCMIEALSFFEKNQDDFEKKACTIVIDKKFYTIDGKFEYIKYWQKIYKDKKSMIQSLDEEIQKNFQDELNVYKSINDNIAKFLYKISDTLNPEVFKSKNDSQYDDSFCDDIINRLKLKYKPKYDDNYSDVMTFFNDKLKYSSPGKRGLNIINEPEKATLFLERLLDYPIGISKLQDSIWTFRGDSTEGIQYFKRISDTRCLINSNELEIDCVAFYKSDVYYKSFVYVKAKADNPIGVYEYEDLEKFIEFQMNMFGVSFEEYGIYNDKLITLEEYDDGFAKIEGEIVDIRKEAELRIRYLHPYNFVMCGKFHSFNSDEGDDFTRDSLDKILDGKLNIEHFVEQSLKLRKNKYLYEK